MALFRTKYGQIIDENNVEVTEAFYLNYLLNGGTIESTNFLFPNDAETDEEESEKEKFLRVIEEGKLLYFKSQMRLLRRVKKSLITNNRAKTVRTLLLDCYTLLNLGLIELALDNATAIPLQSNKTIENELVWVREKITNLITQLEL